MQQIGLSRYILLEQRCPAEAQVNRWLHMHLPVLRGCTGEGAASLHVCYLYVLSDIGYYPFSGNGRTLGIFNQGVADVTVTL